MRNIPQSRSTRKPNSRNRDSRKRPQRKPGYVPMTCHELGVEVRAR